MGSDSPAVMCIPTVIGILLLLPAILQVWGTAAKDDWSGSGCPHGNNTNNGTTECASTLAEVSQVASNLEVASSVMVMFTVVPYFAFPYICISEDTSVMTNIIVSIAFIGYPISGILSIAGCSLFASKLATAHYGLSFFLCLSAGIITEINSLIGCYCACLIVSIDDS